MRNRKTRSRRNKQEDQKERGKEIGRRRRGRYEYRK